MAVAYGARDATANFTATTATTAAITFTTNVPYFVDGATLRDYDPIGEDVGMLLASLVTPTGGGCSSSARSKPVGPVIVYDSSDTYDFEASLVDARSRARQVAVQKGALQLKADDEYMRQFNSGETYREVTYGYGYATRSKPAGRIVSMTADAEKLRRHAAKFSEPEKKRQRRSTPNMRGQVLELHARGVVYSAIADTMNVSDDRVKGIIRSAAA